MRTSAVANTTTRGMALTALLIVAAVAMWWLLTSGGPQTQDVRSGGPAVSGLGQQAPEADDAPVEDAPVEESPVEDIALPEIDDDASSPREVGLRSDVRHNGAGEVFSLDESASLACSDLEVALAFAEEDPERSMAALESAVERAGASDVPGFGRVAGLLRSVVQGNAERALTRDNVVEAFEACVAGGYEL